MFPPEGSVAVFLNQPVFLSLFAPDELITNAVGPGKQIENLTSFTGAVVLNPGLPTTPALRIFHLSLLNPHQNQMCRIKKIH